MSDIPETKKKDISQKNNSKKNNSKKGISKKDISIKDIPEDDPGDISIEDALSEVEKIIDKLDSPDISLEDSFKAYSEGIMLLSKSAAKIDRVEKEMVILSKEYGKEIGLDLGEEDGFNEVDGFEDGFNEEDGF